jgi:Fe-S oxidoreductase
MAKMKIEVLYQRQRAHGLALKDRLIANLPRWAPWAARMPALFNLRNTLPGAAKLGEAIAGISARRTLPSWRRDAFLRNGDARTDANSADANVVLFVDTFSNYFEPENARAACNVLRAAGYRVHVARVDRADAEPARPLCCGRTYLAAGLVDDAKREARRVTAALAPHVARGAAIVGLEPSCLLSLRDEFLVLGLGDVAQRLSENAFLVEEFLARSMRRRLRLPLAALPQSRALLHGHCHQKAFDAVTPTKACSHSSPAWRSSGRDELLRHGWQLRLRRRALRCFGENGGARAAARRARGCAGHADCRRRNELPASDRRPHARNRSARGGPRDPRAGVGASLANA